jgi:hypothetical protein
MLRQSCSALAIALLTAIVGVACDGRDQSATFQPEYLAPDFFELEYSASPIRRDCPPTPAPRVIEIHDANPAVDRSQHDEQLETLAQAVSVANTTVLLGPSVVLDFSDALEHLPLTFARCVTLASVAARPDVALPVALGAAAPITVGPLLLSARTPSSQGPLLRFGSHSATDVKYFLRIKCDDEPNEPIDELGDHVRISGFRLEGPSLGQQKVDQFGILILRCLDVEVSNMEIFGWGGAGVRVLDDLEGEHGPGQEPPTNRPGDRIGRPEQVRILNNYIHHNQHASEDDSVDCDFSLDWLGLESLGCVLFGGHAAGYGVDVHHGAWAQIHFNLFDVNRHAIAASGTMGGYDARWNLTLKGGGYHGRLFNKYTHAFDIHGAGGNGFGGQAGVQAWFFDNAFQFSNDAAIKIRGRPHLEINIGDNVFPHEGLEADAGDDAIHIDDRDDLDVIHLRPGNVIDVDTYGRYGVCDFDADGIDDLFLATGKTWWFSSSGEFPWSYLTDRTERLEQVRLGYFDDDLKCDVLTRSGSDWVVSSGGTGSWTSIGTFGATLSQVAFGQFDPNHRDHRPGVTRRTTHAFRRLSNGEWLVTSLSSPDWTHVQSSSFPINRLRFGDFTGDGVTDVLGVNGGRWAISESARGSWEQLNPDLGDDVSKLLIADLNHNNIDDLLKLESSATSVGFSRLRVIYKWYVSDDGRSPWRLLKEYSFEQSASEPILSGRAFAGRFGAAPGGGVVVTGPDRVGNFFGPAETEVGARPDWRSLFGY